MATVHGLSRRTFLRLSLIGFGGIGLVAACAPQPPATKPAEAPPPAATQPPAAAAPPTAAPAPPKPAEAPKPAADAKPTAAPAAAAPAKPAEPAKPAAAPAADEAPAAETEVETTDEVVERVHDPIGRQVLERARADRAVDDVADRAAHVQR